MKTKVKDPDSMLAIEHGWPVKDELVEYKYREISVYGDHNRLAMYIDDYFKRKEQEEFKEYCRRNTPWFLKLLGYTIPTTSHHMEVMFLMDKVLDNIKDFIPDGYKIPKKKHFKLK